MEFVFSLPFTILEIPNFKIRKPAWVQRPSAMTTFAFVLLSYFLVTGGIIYDVIIEPPSVGSTTDEHGHSRPVAFMPYRVNAQYIVEGLASSFLFSMGGLGFIVLDRTNAMDPKSTPKLNRILLLAVGFVCVIISFITCLIFMRMKLPGYLR
ncbi:oligosaccharyltransferase complex subunit ostc [Planococcus citri]|uniref:oligosaccharyltransferase complex subunit ostc n=1 Tax=Planococcus citri TaxID=170843 RepID=UPI0031F81CEB